MFDDVKHIASSCRHSSALAQRPTYFLSRPAGACQGTGRVVRQLASVASERCALRPHLRYASLPHVGQVWDPPLLKKIERSQDSSGLKRRAVSQH